MNASPEPEMTLAAEPIDAVDLHLLDALRHIHQDLDPVPEDLVDRVKFAMTVAALEADVDDRLVWHHFASLPERCKSLLRVIAFAERPDYAAVAQSLGMPVGSIGPTRGRCLAKLRQALTTDPRWEMPS